MGLERLVAGPPKVRDARSLKVESRVEVGIQTVGRGKVLRAWRPSIWARDGMLQVGRKLIKEDDGTW